MSPPYLVFDRTFGLIFLTILLLVGFQPVNALTVRRRQQDNETSPSGPSGGRERSSLNTGWQFWRSETNPDGLSYGQLKEWILSSANDFISDAANHHSRPSTDGPASDISYVQTTFDDGEWDTINLPHDWAIKGPFYTGDNVPVGGGMGRLPIHGVGWYRRKISFNPEDEGKSVYLDIDGAMSYAMVWLNGNLVGGWPFGYASFRLDLTPYLTSGQDNQLAIRLDNPLDSSRWYSGGGIYRSVWLTKVDPTHIAQWGTFITTEDVSSDSATVQLVAQIENEATAGREVELVTDIHALDPASGRAGEKVTEFPRESVSVEAGETQSLSLSTTVETPALWGPHTSQQPNLYVAITRLYVDDEVIDTYETQFGIRSLIYDPDQGLLVNGEHVRLQGVNQHHDLGALGAAFNVRAAERQLEKLQDLGCNAIRMSHNPPSPQLLELTDRMGFLVMDEAFDAWQRGKVNNDYHLLFDDWHEPDLRALLRRDRNHPSIFAWSFGNEVSEQRLGTDGASVARKLAVIVAEEDSTRPSTASMNAAKPNMPFPAELDIISLNYQGEGIYDGPAYSSLGSPAPPLFADFHSAFPRKMVLSSESSSALSTRGTFIFPVTVENSAPVTDNSGGGGFSLGQDVSAYELYSANWGASPDKVFAAQDAHPFVAGEFVWTGWDYLGEPTPYYSARSSYFGIIDLAGFPKDRFYLYQARWRAGLEIAHILPHWTWPDRVGLVTPVHVFSSGDEAELFLNGESLGRKTKGEYEYRFRWDDVVYTSGELHVVTYKDGEEWAVDTVRTVGEAKGLTLTPDRATIRADGEDLSFVTVQVVDEDGNVIPEADNTITFSIDGPGEIVATDNGDPADMTAFPSKERNAFSGLALVIVRAEAGAVGSITVTASAEGLMAAEVVVDFGDA